MISCKRCIYDQNVSAISFDNDGICNYCRQIEELESMYKTGEKEGEDKFYKIVDEIKEKGKNSKYDVIIGVSGGTDSSYLLHLSHQLGLRPLAVHYDNTWNTAIATQNIKKVVTKLNIDLDTYVIDSKEQDTILLSFMKAGICGVDAATDLALAEVMYRMANKHNVAYVFEGHSFQTEGVSPIGVSYTDGQFIKSVVKVHSGQKLKSYPNMTFWRFLRWVLFKRIKKIRPLWYIKYNKKDAQDLLAEEYGWMNYGGHHLENRISAFDHSFLMPTKFQVDQRNNSLSASVRSKLIDRNKAVQLYAEPPLLEQGIINYVKKRLKLNESEFNEILNGPIRNFTNYKTYKGRFEKFRFLFSILAKVNLVPYSFYQKYCFPIKDAS